MWATIPSASSTSSAPATTTPRLFFDQYAKGKFAHYLFDRHENPPAGVDADIAQQIIGEANLFIEAAHACDARMAQTV